MAYSLEDFFSAAAVLTATVVGSSVAALGAIEILRRMEARVDRAVRDRVRSPDHDPKPTPR